METHAPTTQTPAGLRVFVLAALLFALTVLPAYILRTGTLSGEQSAAIIRSAVVRETNMERALYQVPRVRTDPLLMLAAQRKANDMAKRGYFAHESPEGREPWYWLEQVGYPFTHAGENLALRYTDSEEVVRAWMASDSHRANVLNGDFAEVGIGVAEGVYEGKRTTFVVQLFGTEAYAGTDVSPTRTTQGALAVASGVGFSYLAPLFMVPEVLLRYLYALVGGALLALGYLLARTPRGLTYARAYLSCSSAYVLGVVVAEAL